MLEKLKANILFNILLKRPNIDKAYAMVDESDSWYDTISKVHKSLDEIQKLEHETLEITSDDNIKLRGIYYKNEQSDVTVICVHGYRSHAEREWAFPGLFYHSLGYNVLIPYLRAHGISEGKFLSFGALETLDILNWIHRINEINPNGKIILHGLSMGGGIVLDLANKEIENVKCLIADAPSVSIAQFFKNVAKEVFKNNSNLIADYAIKRFNKEYKCDVNDFESVNIVSNSKYPLLLSAGSEEHLEELFEIIKSVNPKETDIIILPGCNHGNGMYKKTEMYQNHIKNFINRHLNTISYPAIFSKEEENDGYNVTVPDIFGGVTCGDNYLDAIKMAKDLIKLMLKEAPGQCFPPKTYEETKNNFPDEEVVMIEVNLD